MKKIQIEVKNCRECPFLRESRKFAGWGSVDKVQNECSAPDYFGDYFEVEKPDKKIHKNCPF